MKKTLLIAGLLAVAVFASVLFLGAEYRQGKGTRTSQAAHKITGTPVSTMINVNFVASWYEANGEQERNPSNQNSGLYYPRGTSTAIYSAGIIWGGLFNDGVSPTIRVNGQSYNNGTKPGAILGLRTGVAEDPNNSDVRIWRIRKDYATADLKRDAAEVQNQGNLNTVTEAQVAQTKDQYAKDWAEWPWQKGAPFYDIGYLDASGVNVVGANDGVLEWGEDLNQNGVLDPGEDANGNGQLDAERPGIASADQVIWYVCNDIGVAQPWSCPETGMEEQATIWAYNRTDPIGNVIFKKFRLVYKGTGTTPVNANITNMYMMQWADPDLGDSGDDFAGSDTVLSLMYVYNGNAVDASYAQFGLVPPASGYDFLQGPRVDGVAGEDRNKNGIDDAADYGIWNLRRVGPGVINLPMTAAIYFAAGGTYSDPPFNYSGGVQWYQMLRGLPPTPQGPPDPPMVVNPSTGLGTPYWLSGDPVTRTGWIDGVLDPPGDRRICLASGPFNMALGDTQELVSAWVGGLGSNYINSVAVMKFNDRFVQTAYDSLFRLSGPPENARVEGYGINDQIVLDWGWDSAAVARSESVVVIGNYQFEGYKLYQFADASGDLRTALLLGQWDIRNGVTTIRQPVLDSRTGELVTLPVQYGSDNGLIHSILLTKDEFRSTPFITGNRYYFAVTAYNYTPDVANDFKTYESSPVIVTVIPETPKPGTRYAYTAGDTVSGVTDLVGRNSAIVNPVIFSPSRQAGASYQLRFDTTAAGAFRWTLTNVGTGKTIFKNVTDLVGTAPYPVAESGFNLFVGAPLLGVRTVVNENGRNVFGVNSSDQNYDVITAGNSLVDLQGLAVVTGTRYQIRFDGVGSYVIRNGQPPSVQAGVYRAPFSVWDIGRMDADTPRQVIAWVKWDKVPATRQAWSVDTARVVIGGVRYNVFEAITITTFPYPAGPADSAAIFALRNTINPVGTSPSDQRAAVFQIMLRDKQATGAYPPQGAQITINKYLKLKSGDVKIIAPNANVVGDAGIAAQDVTMIKAFPNPYYGVNRQETDRTNRFVTFNHLPRYAILRIFNLAGVLVRRIEKNDPTTQFLRWDLQNQNGYPVASGIYIVYIEMPELNVTKTLKVAIIQEQQFLRNF